MLPRGMTCTGLSPESVVLRLARRSSPACNFQACVWMHVGSSQTCFAGLPLNKNNMAAWATDAQTLFHPTPSNAELRGERATTAIRDNFVLFYGLQRLYSSRKAMSYAM